MTPTNENTTNNKHNKVVEIGEVENISPTFATLLTWNQKAISSNNNHHKCQKPLSSPTLEMKMQACIK
jgi:hypothetical protein